MSCKGLGIALKQTMTGTNQLANPLTWFLLLSCATCISVQLNYMNKALDIFNTSVVTPLLYVVFTGFVILASVILFDEWKGIGGLDAVGILCGLFIVIAGVFILQGFKDLEISMRDYPRALTSSTSHEDYRFSSSSLNTSKVKYETLPINGTNHT